MHKNSSTIRSLIERTRVTLWRIICCVQMMLVLPLYSAMSQDVEIGFAPDQWEKEHFLVRFKLPDKIGVTFSSLPKDSVKWTSSEQGDDKHLVSVRLKYGNGLVMSQIMELLSNILEPNEQFHMDLEYLFNTTDGSYQLFNAASLLERFQRMDSIAKFRVQNLQEIQNRQPTPEELSTVKQLSLLSQLWSTEEVWRQLAEPMHFFTFLFPGSMFTTGQSTTKTIQLPAISEVFFPMKVDAHVTLDTVVDNKAYFSVHAEVGSDDLLLSFKQAQRKLLPIVGMPDYQIEPFIVQETKGFEASLSLTGSAVVNVDTGQIEQGRYSVFEVVDVDKYPRPMEKTFTYELLPE